ncbi:hypothetical protein [Aeromonas simiae]|uniref:Uncharacterized protein n=1 Tax=Aeromonas simiae TaxID=218936 RepID=A0A5J6WUF9_9GAMM|nr:hypothetical protein [Aeromonas simiae]QFI54786.1 hypothetical protein FE240_08835 [Aeromonas simiae]
MNHIEKAVSDLEHSKSRFNASASEMDAIRNKQAELKAMIADAKSKLDNWKVLAPSAGVAEAMADRQSSRDLANHMEDASELLEALKIDDECHWPDLANAHAALENARNKLRYEYKRLANAEITGRIKMVTAKLLPHIGGLAELAVIKKIAEGEEAAIAWAQAELMKLLKPAMDNVDTDKTGVRMDIAEMLTEQVNTKYHHEISKGSSPAYKCKVNHMKNRK